VPKRGVVPLGPGSSASDDPNEVSVRSTGSKTERSGGASNFSSESESQLEFHPESELELDETAGKPPVGASSSSSADQELRGSLTDGKPGASASSPETAGSGPVVSSGVEY
jgi:hypothetical protein